MELGLLQYLLGAASGAVVGLSLALVGGGGSILAVPLLVYLVGVGQPHLAIGTAALAVAANAAQGLWQHARRGNVRWPCGGVFAAVGAVGAWGGSTLGKAVDGQALLALFAVLMLVVAGLMFRHRRAEGDPSARLGRENAPRLFGSGLVAGGVAGFFGIGGGFLIVPSLMWSARLPILLAIGSSLVAVTAFGLTTALNYARSGWVDWTLAAVLIGGGWLGSQLGASSASRLAARRGTLNIVFASIIVVVAVYMLYRSLPELGLLA
ncbi:sulfite exporter TauE/SafE family protein [Pseudomarimonas salicorniae]|uniref:Probable membrane transporter protein n=1 Tax=Pseudomarimonas salicorniae TaxID=2933270 RepID=A0ABT0GM98_9GAMM|nr:sulfite exporter TauE/SafE family protein [Lysobacter sp. CAU 1642]